MYRRLIEPVATFDEPFGSIVGGHATYSFRDTDVHERVRQWIYGVTALDCSPSNSPMVTASAVTIP